MGKGKLRLKRRERTLLLNSHIIEDEEYAWLHSLLENNKRITYDLVANLPSYQQIFFDTMLDHIISQAVREWKGNEDRIVEDLELDRDRCALCNQPIRYVFYIVNKQTGLTMNVGRECVKHFGIKVKGSVDQLCKDATRIKRLSRINTRFPGIERIVDRWDDQLKAYPVTTLALENTYEELGKSVKNLYEDYLNERCDDEVFKEIGALLDKRDSQLIKIEQYIADNAGNKYLTSKEVRSWLEYNDTTDALTKIKEDGQITWRTVHRIEEPQFMESTIVDFNKAIKSLGLKIERIDRAAGRNGYVIECKNKDKVRLFSKYSIFTLEYGGLLFEQEIDSPLSFEGIVERCSIFDDRSIDIIIRKLASLTKGSGAEIRDYDTERNDFLVFEKASGKYMVVNGLQKFADRFKLLALEPKKQSVDTLVEYINNLQVPRYTAAQINDTMQYRIK